MGILNNKKGLIMGVANERSIAWGIAKALSDQGAELAFSYQGEQFGRRLKPLADSIGSKLIFEVDVTDDVTLDKCFDGLSKKWDNIDFLVHAIAYSEKSELTGRFLDTSRKNFLNTLNISTYSFIEVARRAHPLMKDKGGCLISLTFQGSNRVSPFYNVMGVAKAGLESATRYLAADLGPDNIRVNAISPGPMRTLAGAAVGGARNTYKFTERNSPLGSNASLEAVGGTAVYLISDSGKFTSGEIIVVDGGYHIMGMPRAENI
ncbi:MAG: enoyl-ACP reductase [Pseudomonadota bacterium]|nr:enoyl-ACP reductase [Pseudomonadota bacterium]